MAQDLTDDKSTLVQVMAWCRQAASHYLNQCWPRSPMPYGVTRPQWVNAHVPIQMTFACDIWIGPMILKPVQLPWDCWAPYIFSLSTTCSAALGLLGPLYFFTVNYLFSCPGTVGPPISLSVSFEICLKLIFDSDILPDICIFMQK